MLQPVSQSREATAPAAPSEPQAGPSPVPGTPTPARGPAPFVRPRPPARRGAPPRHDAAGPEVSRGPRAGLRVGGLTPTPIEPFSEQVLESPADRSLRGQPQLSSAGCPLALPHICPLLHLRLDGAGPNPDGESETTPVWGQSVNFSLLLSSSTKWAGFLPCFTYGERVTCASRWRLDLGVSVHV